MEDGEPELPELEVWGEHTDIPADVLAGLPQARNASSRLGRSFLRQAANITDVDGTDYKVGLHQIEATPLEDEPGRFRAILHSHKKEITIGGAALLGIVAGAGVSYALNRTQRKKMR